MLNTILLDLDGTLINIDSDEFMKEYMIKLYPRIKSILKADEFDSFMKESIMAAIISQEESKTNEEVFIERFKELTEKDVEKIYCEINKFYEDEYTTITGMYSKSKHMIKAIKILKEKRYNLVVATNPLFPYIGVAKRVEWGGFDPLEFQLITSIDKMNFCKPNPRYYSQILDIIQRDSSECLMVGNDVQEDLVASEVGIRTYLITNNIINRTGEKINSDYVSDAKGFYKFVKTLPVIPEI